MKLTNSEFDILEDLIIAKEIEYQVTLDKIAKLEQTTKECYDFYHKKISELSTILATLKTLL